MTLQKDMQAFKAALQRIASQYPESPRGDISNFELAKQIERGAFSEEVERLIAAYAKLRVLGYDRQPAFISTFCSGVPLRWTHNRSATGIEIVESSAVYKAEFAAHLIQLPLSEFWSAAIAATELTDVAKSARRNHRFGIEKAALKMRDRIIAKSQAAQH